MHGLADAGGVPRRQRLARLDQFVGEMITLFLDYTQTKLVEARQALSAGDAAGVGRAVHPIKSSAGNVGAVRVQELAARIEQLAKQPPGAELRDLLDQLEQAFAAGKPGLEAERTKLESKPV